MLIGIGGGGDIVGTIPTSDLLGLFDIECVLGGHSWERSVIDPMPGPRKFDEVRNARKLNEVVWFANKDTVTSTGVRFAESGVAEVLGEETLLINIHPGPEAVADGILHAAGELGADLIIGIDVGGDLLALGNEPGLMSPLADSIMTASFAMLEKRMPAITPGIRNIPKPAPIHPTISTIRATYEPKRCHALVNASPRLSSS